MDGDFEQVSGDEQGKSGEFAAKQPLTGDERVDEAIGGLASLADMPVDEHPAALGDVYQKLSDILGEAGDDASPA